MYTNIIIYDIHINYSWQNIPLQGTHLRDRPAQASPATQRWSNRPGSEAQNQSVTIKQPGFLQITHGKSTMTGESVVIFLGDGALFFANPSF